MMEMYVWQKLHLQLAPLPIKPRIVLLLTSLLISNVFSASYASNFHNLSFSFPSFGSNNHEVLYQGDASLASSAISLTVNRVDASFSVGRAVYFKPMHLWDNSTGNTADFSTRFSFSIDSLNRTSYGDGMVFFLAPNGSTLPSYSAGGYFGLLTIEFKNSSDTGKFVAVEFDTFWNTRWDPARSDNSSSYAAHVGIDIDWVKSESSEWWDWGHSTIMSGGKCEASITYNSSSQNLSLFLTDGMNNSTSLSYPIKFKDHLPEWVTFGLSAGTGSAVELHTIYSWEFNSSLQIADSTETNQTRLWVILGLCAFFLIGTIVIVTWFCRRKSRREGDDISDEIPINEEFEKVAGPRKFSYRELAEATNNFSVDHLLGQGGFGKVYEGYLSKLEANVAIKKITPESSQGLKEYAAEVKTISQLRHRNLVQLLGWCHENRELLLIYEIMSNGSLDSHLFKGKSLLTWETRYKIVLDLAFALLYLHEECAKCVLHRDIKCSNILLDSSFAAKLGDFGLARLVDHDKESRTTMLAGTMGYMAPECIYTYKASKESDMYSFGVVALEIACGRKVVEPTAKDGQVQLVNWVWDHYGIGRLLDAADPKLENSYDTSQMKCLMIVGLWCSHPDPAHRPSIREALSMLKFDVQLPVLPSKMPVPTYAAPLSNGVTSSTTESSASASTTSSSEIKTSPASPLF